jgi:hypothetical protein
VIANNPEMVRFATLLAPLVLVTKFCTMISFRVAGWYPLLNTPQYTNPVFESCISTVAEVLNGVMVVEVMVGMAARVLKFAINQRPDVAMFGQLSPPLEDVDLSLHGAT